AVRGFHPQDVPGRCHASSGFWIDRAGRRRHAGNRLVLAGWRDALFGRRLVDVQEAYLLHGIDVIEVPPELLEAVRGGKCIGMIAEVVLAELSCRVTEIDQDLCKAWRGGSEVRRTERALRRNHTCAHRSHASNEGVASRRAARLGVVGHEPPALLGDAIDIWCFTHHQALVIAAWLHPA